MSKRNEGLVEPGNSVTGGGQTVLSPIVLAEGDGSYHSVKYLDDALGRKDVYNVAVSGPYGSGKSSVLKTFEELNDSREPGSRHSILNISLATLNGRKPKGENDASIRSVEYSILQQILFREKYSTLPASHFSKIPYRDKSVNLAYAEMSLAAALAALYLFLKYKTLAGVVVCIGVLAALFFHLMYCIIVRNSFPQMESLKVSEMEMKLKSFSPDSIFNKYIDEIVYFFKKTDYDVVVFEDIDRFDSPELFCKLREINTILNNNKDITGRDGHPRIVFVYALKDEIFKKCEDRTKFFDIIIPVIPFINSQNSEMQLKKELEQRGFRKWEDAVSLKEISFFLTDMRLLKNVTNEFAQFADGLGIDDSSEQDRKTRLLAMILYKNLNPSDFSLIHKGKGALSKLFESVSSYKDWIEDRLASEIEGIEAEEKDAETRIGKQKADLRFKYLSKAFEEYRGRVEHIVLKGNNYSLSEVSQSDVLFDAFRNGTSVVAFVTDDFGEDGQSVEIGYDFSKIESLVGKQSRYQPGIDELDMESLGIRLRLSGKKTQKNELSHMSAGDLYAKYGFDSKFHAFEGQDFAEKHPVLTSMVKLGYIREDYMVYLSYCFEGAMSSSDWNALQDMRTGKPVPFTKHIDNVEDVCLNIPDYVFDTDSILIVELVRYIAANKQYMPKYWEKVKGRVVRNEALPFLAEYFSSVADGSDVLSHAINNNYRFWSSLQDLKDRESSRLREAFLLYAGTYRIDSAVVSWIEENCKFVEGVVEKHGLDALDDKLLRCRFRECRCSDEKFFDYIVGNSLYRIDKTNLSIICSRLLGFEVPQDDLTLTDVLRTHNDRFIDNVCSSLQCCIDNVFSGSRDLKISEEAVLRIVNNESVPEETVFRYLSARPVLKDLGRVMEHRRGLAFENGLAEVSWWNVGIYYSFIGEINDCLKNYLQDNLIALKKDRQFRYNEKFAAEFALLDSISFPAYKQLLPIICNGYDIENGRLGSLQEDKVHALIKNGSLPFSLDNVRALEKFKPTTRASYCLRFPAAFRAAVDKVEIGPEEGAFMLNSSKIDTQTKLAVIKKFTADDFNGSPALSTAACKVIARDEDGISLDEDIWIAIISNAADAEAALSLSISLMNNDANGKDFALMVVGAQKGKLGRIAGASVVVPDSAPGVKDFLEQAKKWGFINNYFPVSGGFRVSHKRKSL